ncbi:phage major capsid protein [Amycolatopsis methanolica]|uniref:phage major capsid protein n=1 Tax=Amycolatopsis methanolica TaxID=1814 RepID=UPI0012E0A2AA
MIGDFTNYTVNRRTGLTVELVPHLLHTANNRPYAARGFIAYSRLGAGVSIPEAFRLLNQP